MEEKPILEALGESYGYLHAYVEKRVEGARLSVIEKVSTILAVVILLMILGGIFLFIAGLASVALALHLGREIGSFPQAFLLVAGGYLLLGILVFLLRRPLIVAPLLSLAIQILDDENDQHQHQVDP